MPARIESPEPYHPDARGSINDIGGSSLKGVMMEQLLQSFVRTKQRGGRPSLPEEPLYDDEGLRIWSGIIYGERYYQTKDEISLLKENGQEIARYIKPGTTILDLGAGDTRKVAHLLEKFDRLGLPMTYLALDISYDSLYRGIKPIAHNFVNISCQGLWGSFTHLQAWMRKYVHGPRLFLSLGSVLFNDDTRKAIKNLNVWAQQMNNDDLLLAGMDGHRIPEHEDKIWNSYHGEDCANDWSKFWKNGFKRVNDIIGKPIFRLEDWDVDGEVEAHPVSHRFVFRAKRDVEMDCLDVKFRKGEEWDWFDAHKNGETEVRGMCAEVGLEVLKVWKNEDSEMTQYLIRRKRNNRK